MRHGHVSASHNRFSRKGLKERLDGYRQEQQQGQKINHKGFRFILFCCSRRCDIDQLKEWIYYKLTVVNVRLIAIRNTPWN